MTGCDNNCGKGCGSCSNCNNCYRKCKCKNKKYKPICPPDRDDDYSAKEICCKYAGAVVSISSQAYLTDENPDTFEFASSNLNVVEFNSNGAFISLGKCLYVLCSSAAILMPPTMLANNNRYPFVDNSVTINGLVPTEVVRYSKILVTLRNFKGRPKPSKCDPDGHMITYEAEVCFVDGAGGYGLLQITGCPQWNQCLEIPTLKTQPHFCLGSSRSLRCGQKVFLMGNPGSGSHLTPTNTFNVMGAESSFGISQGVIINHRGADHTGWLLPELLVVDASGFSTTLGMPIINRFGELVGLQLTAVPSVVAPAQYNELLQTGNGIVAGVAEEFMKYPLQCFIQSCKRKCDPCCREHIQSVRDSVGSYCKYVKGYAGIAYTVTDPTDWNTKVSVPGNGTRTPLFTADGNLYTGPKCKYLEGITVTTLAGDATLTYAVVPGAAAPPPFDPADLNDSNFLGTVPPGAIILRSDGEKCCAFGDGPGKVVPSLATWKTIASNGDGNCCCCDEFGFEMRVTETTTPDGRIVVEDNGCQPETVCVSKKMLSFPAVNDYPWGVINNIPIYNLPGPLPIPNSYLPEPVFVPSL